jgi:hypothetical protein
MSINHTYDINRVLELDEQMKRAIRGLLKPDAVLNGLNNLFNKIKKLGEI